MFHVTFLNWQWKIPRRFQNVVCLFLFFWNSGRYEERILSSIESTLKADHVLEVPGLEEFFIIVSRYMHVEEDWRINAANYFQD